VPVNIEIIESFMHTVSYQDVVDKDFMNCVFQKKDVIQYPRFTKLIINDLMKKCPSILKILDEDYYSIKDDISLVSVYSIGNVLFRGMQIPNAFLTNEIRATKDYKEYETVFIGVDVPMNQTQPVVSTQGTYRTTTRAHRIPTLTAASPQEKNRKHSAGEKSSPRKSLKVTIKQKPKTTSIPPPTAEEQENVANVQEKRWSKVKNKKNHMLVRLLILCLMMMMMIPTKIEPGSYKENPKVVDDEDDVNVFKKKDDEKNDEDVEKTYAIAKEKNNDAMGSMETRNALMQKSIPTLTRSPRKDLSSNKIVLEELMALVSQTTATTSKSKSKRGFTSNKKKIIPGTIIIEVLDHCNNVVPSLTFAKTNEMIKEEMPRLVDLAVHKDREITSTNVPELISKEFATHRPKMIEELFRKHMQNTTLNIVKFTAIEKSKDLTSLSLNELIENLKVYEMIIKKDSKIVKAKRERKSLALKAKKESSDEESSTSGSEDEEYAMAARDFKKFFERRGEFPKPPKDKNQRVFVRGSWSDSSEEDDEQSKDKTCLMA
ncbi:hypothetical protein Tco_1334207, partial [Tanacetum coccineum]